MLAFKFSETRAAHEAYAAIVTLARSPKLYSEYGIPDSLDGRFEAILLHVFLLFEHYKDDPSKADFCRKVGEAFFKDMDRSLREMGVGDTGVSKRIQKMASAYMGRIKAYSEAYGDDAKMQETLSRNVWRSEENRPEAAKLLVYIKNDGASRIAALA